MTTDARVLTAELERAAVRALLVTYAELNAEYFKGRLRCPPLALSESPSRLGQWSRDPRRLEVSRSLLVSQGWGVLVEVLKHEMAHQYVDELLGAHDEPAHGPMFRKVCEERGFDARAAGLPEGATRNGPGPVLDRISKLLALAESSNEHEARAAAAAAQRLMLKYNLEEAARGKTGAYGFRHVGRATGRISEAEHRLASILADHFFVDVVWVSVFRPLEGKRGSVLEICGQLENLEMAEFVHTFLLGAAERLWIAHRKRSGIRGNRDRRAYLAGVMAGFEAQLVEQARKDEAAGLVWVGDPDLTAYFKSRHPRTCATRGSSSHRNPAHAEGIAAGRRIVLHKGVEPGPSGAVRLLGRGR